MEVSRLQLNAIMPHCPVLRAVRLLPHLNEAMAEFGINTPVRAAAFLAQIAHESSELRHFEELASGEKYEGRVDLGNVQPGDGRRYKGRGPIQLTGRANYRKAGAALEMDLEADPRRASDADVGFRVAGWFWDTHDLNELADLNTGEAFDRITRRINGGLNHKFKRDAFHRTARQVLGVDP